MALKDFIDSIDDKFSAEMLVREVFKEISHRFGEEKAAKMFFPYGKFNNKDRTAYKNAGLISRVASRARGRIERIRVTRCGSKYNGRLIGLRRRVDAPAP
jgi:hypothetical protein